MLLRDQYECPVCLEICAEPVASECVHYFCYACQKKILATPQHNCPICRETFDKNIKPQIDRNLQLEIKFVSPDEFDERKEDLKRCGQWKGGKSELDIPKFTNKIPVQLLFGNQYFLDQKEPKFDNLSVG